MTPEVAVPGAVPVKPAALVVGGGPFGRALAEVARRHGAHVALWSRRADVVLLDGIARPGTLAEATAHAEVVFFCVPASHARPALRLLGDVVGGQHLLVHAGRGLEPPGPANAQPTQPSTISQIVRAETPIRRVGVLAGPLVPDELAASIPSAIVVASRYPEVIRASQAVLSGPDLRVYGSDDLTGVELAAALMTVVAFAAGLVTGVGGGISTRALIVARGIAQSARVLEALEGRSRTLAGLGGIGEVFVTAHGAESPDYELGLALARGLPLEAALGRLGRTAESPSVARCVAALAAERGVRAPLFAAMQSIMEGRTPAQEALRGFLITAPTEL